ncbi:MAG TPA: lytic transglycosylase domain-containing protein [Caulobacteraceae bacterium]|nr:lytic transglycosylase domain-containing protein [Caulobacteraceae bacterium]
MTSLRALLAIGLSSLTLAAAAQGRAATLEALSDTDAQLYASAFQAAERGDFATADANVARVSDPCLKGRIEYLKLTRGQTQTPSYDDLVGWLKAFKDLPGAEKIYALALKLRPAGAEPPAPETAALGSLGGGERASAQSRPAREAYFDGDLQRALKLARGSGDAWIAGLASYRLQAYPDAMGFFETLARNTSENDAVRAGAAFWAARAAEAADRSDRVTEFLRIAAALPDTFYGMIAARRLQLTDDPLGKMLDASLKAEAAPMQPIKVSAGGLAAPSVMRLIQVDPRARRAIALSQIGRQMDAGLELRTGLALAQSEDERIAWTTLVYALNPNRPADDPLSVKVGAPAVHGVVYPTPPLQPVGGFTVNRALVYAIGWQESRFDPLAVSPAGAVGMMQVMPPTAARVAGDDSLSHDLMPLFDGPTNLQVGQQYLAWLMDKGVGYDVLRVVAAYNGGPGVVARTQTLVGPNADSLLLLESLPYYETRGYVQKVMAAYWSYRRQFGADTRTLDALASGQPIADIRLDK